MDFHKMVQLKNGTSEPSRIVTTISMVVNKLYDENPIAFIELVSKCRDAQHKLFGNTEEILRRKSLVNNNGIHSSIRNIVLSMVEGEGLEMIVGSPLASE